VANYNWNVGDWYVFGGLGATAPSRGAFGANRSRRLAEFTDGLSNTVWSSEVKTYQPVLTKCTLSTVSEPASIPSPAADPYAAGSRIPLGPVHAQRERTRRMGGRRGPRDRVHHRLAAEQGDLRGPDEG
jgi:hypothetical protein